jgi:hypothetical protein
MEMLRAKPSAPPPPAAREDDPFDMGPLDGDDTGEGSRADDADLARPYGAEAPDPDTEIETGDAAEPASFAEADVFGLDDAEPIDPSALEPDAGSGPGSATDALESSDATPLSPAMREELRDTLERIAWDAFGEVTEKIVKQALEQIERIAWEVVPKLAETLIQEEIRRLKGDGSER